MNTALLKYTMERMGVDVETLCAYIGISKSAYYKKINGKSEFTRNEIQKICECLHLESPVDIFFAEKVS